jgi:hypothetical protein
MKQLFLLAIALCFPAHADITILSNNDSNSSYAKNLLKAALPEHDINVMSSKFSANGARKGLESGAIDVIYTSELDELNERFNLVDIDIYDGMMGVRVCMTNDFESTERLMKSVRSLEDLKKIKFTSGKGWLDTKILRKAGLNIRTNPRKEVMIEWVENNIVHCYARAAHEVSDEVMKHKWIIQPNKDRLKVDKNFIIRYTNRFVFYVRKDDMDLHSKLTERLPILIKQKLPNTKQYRAVNKLNIHNRYIIDI